MNRWWERKIINNEKNAENHWKKKPQENKTLIKTRLKKFEALKILSWSSYLQPWKIDFQRDNFADIFATWAKLCHLLAWIVGLRTYIFCTFFYEYDVKQAWNLFRYLEAKKISDTYLRGSQHLILQTWVRNKFPFCQRISIKSYKNFHEG